MFSPHYNKVSNQIRPYTRLFYNVVLIGNIHNIIMNITHIF